MAITKEVNVSLKMDSDLLNKINAYANENEMDKSKIIRLALKKFLSDSPVNVKKQTKTT